MFLLEIPKLTGASGLEGALEIVRTCFIGKAMEAEVIKCIAQGQTENERRNQGSRVDLSKKYIWGSPSNHCFQPI